MVYTPLPLPLPLNPGRNNVKVIQHMLALLAIAFGKDMATATVISLEPFLEATQPSLNKQATRASLVAAARPPPPPPPPAPPATTTTAVAAAGTVAKSHSPLETSATPAAATEEAAAPDPPKAEEEEEEEVETAVHRKSVDPLHDHPHPPTGLFTGGGGGVAK